jgi:hypothetical protein
MATKYAGYIYDSNKKLIKKGELTYDSGTGKYTLLDDLPTINQGDTDVVRIMALCPSGTFADGMSPYITIESSKGWSSGFLTATKANFTVIDGSDETTYQSAYFDLNVIGATYHAGVHMFVMGWLGNGSRDNLELSKYTVEDGINDYDNIEADTYQNIFNSIIGTWQEYADRLINTEDFLTNAFNYTKTPNEELTSITFYDASGTAVLTYNGTDLILNKGASNEEILTDTMTLADVANVIETNIATDDILIRSGSNYVNISKADFLQAVTDRLTTNEGAITTLQTEKEDKSNKITAWNTPTDVQYPSAKLTKDTLDLKEDKANKGATNGYAPLVSGKVPSTYIPNSYDNYEEVATYADLPAEGRTDTVYVVIADETSGDNTSTYRWTGSVYGKISDVLSASEVKTLYESNADTNAYTDAEKTKVQTAYDHSQETGNAHDTTFAQLLSKPTTLSGFGILDAYTKSEVDSLIEGLKALKNVEQTDLTPSGLASGDTIAVTTIDGYDLIVVQAQVDNTDASVVFVPNNIAVGDSFVKVVSVTPAVNLTITKDATNYTFTVDSGTAIRIDVDGWVVSELTASEIEYDNTTSGIGSTNVQDAIDELLSTEEKIEYGVRWVQGQSSPTGERVKKVDGVMTIGSATNLYSTPATSIDGVGMNTFDSIFRTELVGILNDNGDANTFARIYPYFIKEEIVNDGTTIYEYLWASRTKLDGYRTPLSFINSEGQLSYYDIGHEEGIVDSNGALRSITDGEFPTVSQTRGAFRTAARKNDGDGTNTDSKYQITDIAEYNDLIQIPMMIEFATKDLQSIFRGHVDSTYDADTVADGASVAGASTAIVSNADGANFVVGQGVYVSTDSKLHTITNIEADTPVAGQSTLTFDGDAVAILTGANLDPRQWNTGNFKNAKYHSCYYSNNIADGKQPFMWRYIVNPYGNQWKFVDGLKIVDWQTWVTTNPADYDDVASSGGEYASPFVKLNYVQPQSNGYIKELGIDERYPFVRLPKDNSGSSSTYFSDYYYQNSGDRTARVGGDWNLTSLAGPFCWYLYHSLADAYHYIGSRLSHRP